MLVTFNVVVDQPPLFQEAMNSQNSPNIASKVPPTSCHRQILRGIEPKAVHHEVTVRHVAAQGDTHTHSQMTAQQTHFTAQTFVNVTYPIRFYIPTPWQKCCANLNKLMSTYTLVDPGRCGTAHYSTEQ